LVKVPSISNRTPLTWLRSGTGGVMSGVMAPVLLLLRALTQLRLQPRCWHQALLICPVHDFVAAFAALCIGSKGSNSQRQEACCALKLKRS
jgi:fumarate reductase subunit D